MTQNNSTNPKPETPRPDDNASNREYIKREHGQQHVPNEHVGNPMDDADSQTREKDRKESEEQTN